MLKLALILPCYNEAKNLSQIFDGFLKSAKNHGFSSETFRLILVDNGSTDETLSVFNDLLKSDPERKAWVELVRVPTNQGYGHGLWIGLNTAQSHYPSQYHAWTHADGQCDPEDVFLAYERAKLSPHSVCKGSRMGRPFGAWLFSRCFDVVSFVAARTALYDINAQPKVFPSSLTPHLKNGPKGFAFDLFVLLRARECGFKIHSLPVLFGRRLHGHSHWAHSIRSRVKTVSILVRFLVQYSLRRKNFQNV